LRDRHNRLGFMIMFCDAFVILANRLKTARLGINSATDLLINYVFNGILNVYCIHEYYSYCMNVTVMNRPMIRALLVHTYRTWSGFHTWIPRSSVAYPRILFGGGVSANSVEDRGQRERGSGDSSPQVRSSGGSCNLVQEISLHIVKFS